MTSLPNRAKESFERKQGRLDIFSDVFGDDFDVVATTDFHSMVTAPRNYVGIRHELEGAYFLELMNNLRREAKRLIAKHVNNGTAEHPDVVAFREQFETTTHSVLSNRAPRVGNTKNGNDFYVGITFDGLEVYGVPLDTFAYIRQEIATLLRVPTSQYFGDFEQFRSARVIHEVRTDPSKLETVYDAASREEVAEIHKSHPLIPDQQHPLQLGFVDEFGNTRLRAKQVNDVREQMEQATNHHGVIGLALDDKDELVVVHRTQENGQPIRSLRQVPDGKLGLYTNVNDESVGAGYFELVRKWTDRGQGSVDSGHKSIHNVPVGTQIKFVKV